MSNPEFPELAARITSPEVYAQIPSLLQYGWTMAKAQQGHPISRDRMARLKPAYQIDAPRITTLASPAQSTPRRGATVVPMAEETVSKIAQICTAELIPRSPTASAANWTSTNAARGQEIAPERLARLTPQHDQTSVARGRTLGQTMPAVGTVAEQIQPHCQRTQQRLAEIIARRTSGGAA